MNRISSSNLFMQNEMKMKKTQFCWKECDVKIHLNRKSENGSCYVPRLPFDFWGTLSSILFIQGSQDKKCEGEINWPFKKFETMDSFYEISRTMCIGWHTGSFLLSSRFSRRSWIFFVVFGFHCTITAKYWWLCGSCPLQQGAPPSSTGRSSTPLLSIERRR